MRNRKSEWLNYGLEKGHFTSEEYSWCKEGKNIKNYEKSKDKLGIKENQLEKVA